MAIDFDQADREYFQCPACSADSLEPGPCSPDCADAVEQPDPDDRPDEQAFMFSGLEGDWSGPVLPEPREGFDF